MGRLFRILVGTDLTEWQINGQAVAAAVVVDAFAVAADYRPAFPASAAVARGSGGFSGGYCGIPAYSFLPL